MGGRGIDCRLEKPFSIIKFEKNIFSSQQFNELNFLPNALIERLTQDGNTF